jgi:hypothetical protein
VLLPCCSLAIDVYSGSTFFALSKYATKYSHFRFWQEYSLTVDLHIEQGFSYFTYGWFATQPKEFFLGYVKGVGTTTS